MAPLRRFLAIGAVAVGYVVAAKLGLALASVHPSATAVWPPTGLAIAAVLLLGRGALVAVFLGALVANATTAGTPFVWTVIAAGNTLEAAVAAWGIRRFTDVDRPFARAADTARFAAVVLVAASLSATAGVGALLVAGPAPGDAWATWTTWWLGDATGGVVFAPFLLLWGRAATRAPGRPAEALLLVVATAAVGAAIFIAPFSLVAYPLAFFCVPLTTWAAFRFGARGASSASVLLSASAIVGTSFGNGPFAIPDPNARLLVLQSFVAVVSLSALAVAAVAAERRRAEAALRAANESLDASVRARTAELADALDVVRRSDAQFRSAQTMAQMGSWRWDARADLFTPSEELCRIYGLADPTPTPMAAHLASIHPEERDRCASALAEALRAGRDLDVEFRIVRPGGEVRWIHCRGRGAYGAGGALETVEGVCQDVTAKHEADRKKEEIEHAALENERLREIARIKTQFLNTAAHELATPMTPVRIQVHLLRQAVATGDLARAGRSLDILDRNAQRLGVFVRDLLDAARLQEDQMRLDLARLDLREPVGEATEAFADLAARKGVRVDVDCPPGLVVEADGKRVSQVLYNLLSNAVKFTPPGGHVRVAGRRENGSVLVSVEDDGRGIAPDAIGALFQPFSQVHAAGESSENGTGLGLYICKGIVEQHGGRIACTSEGPGRGTRFTVTLPFAGAAPAATR